jgi:hypothetical protein
MDLTYSPMSVPAVQGDYRFENASATFTCNGTGNNAVSGKYGLYNNLDITANTVFTITERNAPGTIFSSKLIDVDISLSKF